MPSHEIVTRRGFPMAMRLDARLIQPEAVGQVFNQEALGEEA